MICHNIYLRTFCSNYSHLRQIAAAHCLLQLSFNFHFYHTFLTTKFTVNAIFCMNLKAVLLSSTKVIPWPVSCNLKMCSPNFSYSNPKAEFLLYATRFCCRPPYSAASLPEVVRGTALLHGSGKFHSARIILLNGMNHCYPRPYSSSIFPNSRSWHLKQ